MKKLPQNVRDSFASWSTGNDNGCYYSTRGAAINAFDGSLQEFNLSLDREGLADFFGNTGWKTVDVHDEFKHVVGRAVITWFRMSSGRYEFISHLA